MPESIETPQTTEPTPEPQVVDEPVVVEPTVVTPEPTWRDNFKTEDFKTNDNFKKYNTQDDMGKAHLELVSMIGKKGVVLPNENDPNDVARYYNQLGRPEEAAKYENPEIEIEDEFKQFYSEEKLNGFKDIAHKYGLTQKQFEGISKEYTGAQLTEIKGIIQAENSKNEESTKSLMNDWLVNYDANSKQSELAIKSFSEGIKSDRVDALMTDPDVKRLFFNVSKSISEDSFKRGDGGKTETAQSLQDYVDSQMKVKGSPYFDQSAPDHKATKRKVREAYSKLEALQKAGA